MHKAINPAKEFLKKIGVNGSIAYTVTGKAFQTVGGVILLLLVARFLTKEEQGYYYTFASILAIQIFFELGLSNIIVQFVAHENANLIWIDKYTFHGSTQAASRLSYLLRFALRWFGITSILLFIGLLFIGNKFFNNFTTEGIVINWQTPWLLLSFSTSLSLLLSPILAFFEGLNKVKNVAKIRLIQQIVQLSLAFMFFLFGFKLLSVPLAALTGFLVILIWLFTGYRTKVIKLVWRKYAKYKLNYLKEIFPFQWKIALSWISGYFIFQLFSPVLFAVEGPVVAGQMGMTIAVLNAILMLSLSWITTKVPSFSEYIARKEYDKLDALFNSALSQSTKLNILALIVFLLAVFILRQFDLTVFGLDLGERFLSYLPLLFMAIPILLNHLISSWATYLRCHKREPLLIPSIVMGAMCAFSTIFLGKYFGVIGVTLGYMIITFIGVFWTFSIFKTMKEKWHHE